MKKGLIRTRSIRTAANDRVDVLVTIRVVARSTLTRREVNECADSMADIALHGISQVPYVHTPLSRVRVK